MEKENTLDMTKGNPLPLLIKFSIPLVLGSIFQQLYSFVDTAIVGRCISVQALSAVGVTGALNFLVLGLTMGSAMGFGIPISQAVGANNKEDISRYFWNGLYLCLGIGLVISVGVSIFVEPLLLWMNTPPELLNMSVSYLRVIFLGQITTVLYNYFAAVLRAFGDSQRPFFFLLVSSGLNIVLDLVLILLIPMGVVGAALATVISQGVSVVLCVWWLVNKLQVIHKVDENGISWMKPSANHLKTSCIIGVPLGLEYSVTSIGNVVLQSSINSMGAVVAAGQICGERIRAIATMPMENVGMAIATYVGQNYGARRLNRIKEGVKAGMIINVVYCAAAWAVLFVLKRPLVYLLLGKLASAEAMTAVEYLTVITTLFVFHGSLMVFRNTVQGMGYSASALAASVMEIIGRSGAGILAVYFNSFFIICVSSPAAWILAMLMCMILYVYYMRKGLRKSS